MPGPAETFDLFEHLRRAADPAMETWEVDAWARIIEWGVLEAGRESVPLTRQLGLEPDDLRALLSQVFPSFDASILENLGEDSGEPPEEERCLRVYLNRFSTRGSWLESRLARILARRCLRPNHLWQDLGLDSRGQLSELMSSHFAPLSARNNQAMRWKKFLYRAICQDEHHGICSAPTCADCAEFETCFGDESGLSLLARNCLPHATS